MSLYDKELEQARAALGQAGRDPAGFDFAMDYLPPEDADGGGMFTMEYQVTVTAPSGARKTYLGSIGRNWVGLFSESLAAGQFD